MKRVYRLLLAIHAFVGIGGMAGGLGAILNPIEPMGAPVELLKNSPFSSFLIPGIILFTVIGLGNVISALTIFYKYKYQGYVSGVIGGALVIWIVVQCIMINAINFMHIIFFVIGLIQCVLSVAIIFKQQLFPSKLIVSFFDKSGKEM